MVKSLQTVYLLCGTVQLDHIIGGMGKKIVGMEKKVDGEDNAGWFLILRNKRKMKDEPKPHCFGHLGEEREKKKTAQPHRRRQKHNSEYKNRNI